MKSKRPGARRYAVEFIPKSHAVALDAVQSYRSTFAGTLDKDSKNKKHFMSIWRTEQALKNNKITFTEKQLSIIHFALDHYGQMHMAKSFLKEFSL